jgi:hypothetical protein
MADGGADKLDQHKTDEQYRYGIGGDLFDEHSGSYFLKLRL